MPRQSQIRYRLIGYLEGELFKQYLPQADKLYLTRIRANLEGDTFFPELNPDEWTVEQEEFHPADENNAYDLHFSILRRK